MLVSVSLSQDDVLKCLVFVFIYQPEDNVFTVLEESIKAEIVPFKALLQQSYLHFHC